MNKQQLIEEINKLPDDIEFLSSKDDEGNGYRWISGISVEYVHKSEVNDYEVEMVTTEEDLQDDYTPEEVVEQFTKVAVIW
jgi:hypothetical protein